MRWLDYIGYILTLAEIVNVIRRMKRYIPRLNIEFIMILTTLSVYGFRKELNIYPRKGLVFRLLRYVNRLITQFLLFVTHRYSRIWIPGTRIVLVLKTNSTKLFNKPDRYAVAIPARKIEPFMQNDSRLIVSQNVT